MATEYVEVEGANGRAIVVTRKAFQTVYAGKGFRVVRSNVEPPKPEPEDGNEDGDEDEFVPPLSAMLRKSIPEIIEWIGEADDEGEKHRRAVAVFQREQEGRGRTTLLDEVGRLAGLSAPPSGDGDDNREPGTGGASE